MDNKELFNKETGGVHPVEDRQHLLYLISKWLEIQQKVSSPVDSVPKLKEYLRETHKITIKDCRRITTLEAIAGYLKVPGVKNRVNLDFIPLDRPKTRKKQPLSKSEFSRETIIELYSSGKLSLSEIAKLAGVSRQRIYQIVQGDKTLSGKTLDNSK